MHWSVTIVMVAALGANAPQTSQEFDSYSKAYRTANAAHRPLLVILNPAGETAESLKHLKAEDESRELLSNFIIANIDTGTEQGQQAYKLFGKPELPRTVIIDERQEKQVFRTSDDLEPKALTAVLEQYRDGVSESVTAAKPVVAGSLNFYQQGTGSCPSCRRFQ